MENTIENAVIKDDSNELRDQLRAQAEEAGPLTGNEFEAGTSSAEKTETRATVDTEREKASNADAQPDNSETDPEKAKVERPRDVQGRFIKTEAGEDIPEDQRAPDERQKPTEKPASEYKAKIEEKARKEQERLAKTWENVNKRKEELEARERAIEEERQRIAQETQQPQQRQQPQREYTSRDLFAAHQDFKTRAKKALETGDYDAFNENEKLADDALQHAQQFYDVEQREMHQAQMADYKAKWDGHMRKAVEAHPDILNPETPLAKEVTRLLTEHGNTFWMMEKGFPTVVELAQMSLKAGSASELEEENKILKAENARLNGNLSLNGSGPSGGPAPTKRFEDMSLDEMKQTLRGVAESAGSLAAA